MEPLRPDTSYHIFNHSNGFENVFRHEANYYFFLEKYRKYISPIAETYAYCLMPNHFHLVVRIRKREVIEELIQNKNSKKTFSKVSNLEKSINITQSKFDKTKSINFGKDISINEVEIYLSKQFANLFSCYTQSFNKVYGRMGSLFIKNFKREPITNKIHFLNTVIYTHRNPIHHGFCKQYDQWNFSSYNDILQGTNSETETAKLLKITGGLESFTNMHLNALKNFDSTFSLEIP
ncbi:MAG TPA: hypothetical protein DHV48_01640 [Prolixibacteraceae bacterium]|nr:hypothetical protein [Prolixibacteraceae bacterium]